MNPDKILIAKQQKIIEDLKAEIAYWEDTAEHWHKEYNRSKEKAIYWQDQYEEIDAELDFWLSYC